LDILLAYGRKGLRVKLPDEAAVTVLEPAHEEALADPQAALREALRRPLAGLPLRELARGAANVGVVFNDITRPTPNHLILPAVLEELAAAGVASERITLFNATGTHRANTAAELEGMLGVEVARRYRIVQNDARAADRHVHVGRTTGGNEVWVLREFVECDLKVLTGFIEPHFVAGFSGGGKVIMPGLARMDTVLHNHGARNIDDPRSTWGLTEGNPLWEGVRAAARLARPSFLVNVALNRDKAITAVFAGAWEKAHARGCAWVKERAMVPVAEPFDVVLTTNSGYPLDLNLYQSVKGMSAAALVVKPGGDIVIAAECWDGIPEHGAFGELLRQAQSPEEVLQTVRSPGYSREDMWEAQLLALVREKARIHMYSDGLSDAQIRSAHLEPCRSIEGTLGELLRNCGPRARICVLPEGPQTIPYLR
jgi:nickel-dependent lactate racemase